MPQIWDVFAGGLGLLARFAFEPLLTGPVLAILLYAPAQTIQATFGSTLFWNTIDVRGSIRVVEVLVAVGVIRTINRALNSWATNNWQIKAGSGWHWSSEIAVVTGGCSGIGRAIAETLVAHGIRAVILDVQKEPKDLATNALLTYYHCDISNSFSIAETANKIRSEIGFPSILINNAGITGSHTILKTPSAFLDQIFATNILSHWRLVQQFVPHMIRENKGHVVTVASVNSFLTNSANADYVATKSAALAFHEGLTSELKIWYQASGVKTTIAHPSWVRTPLIEASILQSGQDPRVLERMLKAEEVADVIVRQILSRRGAQLFIPEFAAPISWLKGLPNWTQEIVRDVFGKTSAVTSKSMIAH